MRQILNLKVLGALTLLLAALGLAWHGQPSLEQKWEFMAAKFEPRLRQRQVYIDPAELLHLLNEDFIHLVIYDVRSEPDWNEFRLVDSEHMPLERMPGERKRLLSLPDNAVIVVVSNDEILATEGWKRLMVIAEPNAYILAGGLNQWLDIYGAGQSGVEEASEASLSKPDGRLRHDFELALGDRHAASRPDENLVPEREYRPKVKLLKKIIRTGGCG